MSVIEGGEFISGFAAGAISSLISSGVQGLGKKISSGLRNAITIASGGLSGGISSSIAGGNFWRGVKQGLITSGLNHVAHGIASKLNKATSKPLLDYEDEINKVIDDRHAELDFKISEQEAILENPNSNKRQKRRAIRRGGNYVKQRNALISAKTRIQKLIHEYHGYNLNATTSGVPSGTKGTLRWGQTNCNITIIFNGSIRVLVHEAIHAYDIIFNDYETSPFKIGSRISMEAQSEINAWQVTYSLRNSDASVSSYNGINASFLKRMGYY